MAKTILNLKLSYKGKLLDIIKQDSDFTRSWYIGTDRHIFWQILDDSNKFPAKHKLLTKQGNDYYLLLPQGSTITCSKEGKPVDAQFLQQNGILNGNQLKIRNDIIGKIQINPDYDIQCEYAEPYVVKLGPTEQSVVTSCSHRPPLSSIERTNRGLIFLFLILGLAFILIYDIVLKPRTDKVQSISEMWAELQRAQRIQFGEGAVQAGTQAEQLPVPEETEQETPKPTGRPSSRPSQAGTTGPSTQSFNLSSSGSRPGVSQATILAGFTTARPGARGGTGLGTPGSTGGTFVPSANAGYAGTYDPDAISGYNASSNIGAVVQGTPPSGGVVNKPSQDVTFVTDPSKLVTTGPGSKPQTQKPSTDQVVQSTTKPVDTSTIETSIVPITPSTSTAPGVDNIFEQLNPRKNQIKQSYQRNAAVKAQSGSITVLMNIDATGKVTASVTPNSSSFTPTFLSEIKTIVEKWHFNVSKATKYQFKINLSQG